MIIEPIDRTGLNIFQVTVKAILFDGANSRLLTATAAATNCWLLCPRIVPSTISLRQPRSPSVGIPKWGSPLTFRVNHETLRDVLDIHNPVLIWLFLLILLPHLDLLLLSFRGDGSWTIDNYRNFFTEPIYWLTFVRTALYSIITTLLT